MSKLLVIFAVVSSCLSNPPGVPIEDTEFAPEFEQLMDAWEQDAALPAIPPECEDLEVAIVPRADLHRYAGPHDDSSGYYIMGKVVMVAEVEDYRGLFAHEATHHLAQCTGLHRTADDQHEDARLWQDLRARLDAL